jgi:hypothetical protein
LPSYKFLLDAAFEEFGFKAVGTDFAVDEFGIAFDPQERTAHGRLIFGNFLGEEDGVVGNFDVILEGGSQIQPRVSLLRRRADEAAEKQRIGGSFGIFHELGDEIVLLGAWFIFGFFSHT